MTHTFFDEKLMIAMDIDYSQRGEIAKTPHPVRLYKVDFEFLEGLAKRRGLNLAQLLREIVAEYVEQQKPQR